MKMKNPNGYGGIVDLGKNRRRPIAVRVPNGVKLTEDCREIPQYKYLGYFERTPQGKKDAQLLLAQYNAGMPVKISSVNSCPTFTECYDLWLDRHLKQIESRKGTVSRQLSCSYNAAFKRCHSIHAKKINCIKFQDIQDIADSATSMSSSTVNNLSTVLYSVFDFARKQKYIDENFIGDIEFNYKKNTESIHDTFSESEVAALWEHSNDENVRIVLIMIYTGLRIEELLSMKCQNVFPENRYMTGGMKTDAGKDRIIPIARKILPFVSELYCEGSYLLCHDGRRYSRTLFMQSIWKPAMQSLKLNHLPHDTRYSCATMMDRAGVNQNCIKEILGLAKKDVTNKVYIKKSLDDLLKAIDMI